MQGATAPANIAGKALVLEIQTGTGPFEGGHALVVLPSVTGSGFSLVGVDNALISGTYTYSTPSASSAKVTLSANLYGQYILDLVFTTDHNGTFNLHSTSGSGYMAIGNLVYLSWPVPSAMQGVELDLSPDPRSGSGTARIQTSATGNSYTMTTGGGVVEGRGTYTYVKMSPCFGRLQIQDSLTGNATAYFGFYQDKVGIFGIKGSSSSEIVSCTLIDRLAPKVMIAQPAVGARILQLPVQVQGTASDNDRVVSVTYTVQNAAGTSPVLTATGTTNWTATIPAPTPGTNLITVTATDNTGNQSPAVSRAFYYVASSALTIQSTGTGTFRPNLSGQFLEIGKSYTITAVPGAGQIFRGWTGTLTSMSPTLKFTMQSNLVLNAGFIPNPFPAVAGIYNGLFPSVNQGIAGAVAQQVGSVSVNLSARGSYTATIQVGGTGYTVLGQFDAFGYASQRISRKNAAALALNLQLGLQGEDMIVGNIGDGQTWTNTITAGRCIYSAKSPAPQAGRNYTFVIPTATEMGISNGPTGYSYGTAKVSASGTISLSVNLADGIPPFTLSTTLAKDGSWPLYQSLNKGAGVLAGWMTCDTNQLGGQVLWLRPADASAKFFPGGFNFLAPLVSSVYVPNLAAMLSWTNGEVQFTGGDLAQSFTNDVRLAAGPKLINLESNRLVLTFIPPSGVFNGNVTAPGTTRATPFKGVLLQNQGTGAGFFSGSNTVGAVLMGEKP